MEAPSRLNELPTVASLPTDHVILFSKEHTWCLAPISPTICQISIIRISIFYPDISISKCGQALFASKVMDILSLALSTLKMKHEMKVIQYIPPVAGADFLAALVASLRITIIKQQGRISWCEYSITCLPASLVLCHQLTCEQFAWSLPSWDWMVNEQQMNSASVLSIFLTI